MDLLNVQYLPTSRYASRNPNLRPEQSTDYNILDLYLPESAVPSTPLIVFIHGGAWQSSKPGNFTAVCSALRQRGVGVAAVGYRLSTRSPGEKVSPVRSPAHSQDVGAGVAWLLAATQFGGDSEAAKALNKWNPSSFFVVGHSGTSQFATIPASVWMPKLQGYIGVEGIYNIPLIAKTFPSYSEWFLTGSFGLQDDPNNNEWITGSPSLVKQFNPPLISSPFRAPHLVIHSQEDELVDVAQSKEWYDHLCSFRASLPSVEQEEWTLEYEVTKLGGKHDDILCSDPFYDYVISWIKKRNL
ncbi:alpha/beta-hydrolase [Rhizoclosmatium globosum]|uniref:Alpha/beta-hydrolase n=1 Tax=Rhizoclosmatium globosum TaxID=329046 RepID=A0A1Y2BV03_9FUNG|nr:alpha/beta-hydrolase [Rhizoclosmatium globosum]|eukprot:ORY38602.1 alpha/beta-hydrolase [Rhizoclosmatium globosum]